MTAPASDTQRKLSNAQGSSANSTVTDATIDIPALAGVLGGSS